MPEALEGTALMDTFYRRCGRSNIRIWPGAQAWLHQQKTHQTQAFYYLFCSANKTLAALRSS